MRKILIATHGKMAEGIKSAASIIVGEKQNVSFINAYVEDISLKDQLTEYFKDYQPSDEIIVLTDIFGGSVNQALIPYIQSHGIYLITGVNLAVTLEIIMQDDSSPISIDVLRNAIEEGKKQGMLVNDILKQSSTDDFDI
ncbi:MAG: PTS fructose transporter subunit IIA [Erysipelotrichaceae bacterium]